MLRILSSLVIAGALAAAASPFTLTSTDVHAGKQIAAANVFNGMGCGGQNMSPALSWSGAPAGTKSFAVTVFDPDAPTGRGWWHWVVYDIPASLRALPQDAGAGSGQNLPHGARQTANDFGGPGYGGPCPPPGSPHRYVFTLYALDAASIDVGSEPAEVAAGLKPHALAEASFTVSYGR